MAAIVRVTQAASLAAHSHQGNLALVRNVPENLIGRAWRKDSNDAILLFGYAGSGKSSLINSVAADLSQTFDTAEVLTLDCETLVSAGLTADQILADLLSVERKLNSSRPPPRLFVLDEFEAISADREAGSGDMGLCYWCMNFVKKLAAHPSLVLLVITNYPDLVDQAVIRHFKSLYLPPPDREAVMGIIASVSRVTEAPAIAEEFARLSASHGLTPSVSGLVDGLNFATSYGYIEEGVLHETVTKIAEAIIAGGSFPASRTVAKYEDANRKFKVGSDLLIECVPKLQLD